MYPIGSPLQFFKIGGNVSQKGQQLLVKKTVVLLYNAMETKKYFDTSKSLFSRSSISLCSQASSFTGFLTKHVFTKQVSGSLWHANKRTTNEKRIIFFIYNLLHLFDTKSTSQVGIWAKILFFK